MKSLMFLWREAANELAAWCRTSATLDYKKLESRVKAEGTSFLTISLPQYAKDFERSLDAGSISSGSFAGFQRKNGLPLFLGGFLKRIFDTSGVLLDEPDVDSIFAIRQLTLMFKKIELPCSDARVARAINGFIECEKELAARKDSTPAEMLSQFSRASMLLWGDAFSEVDRKIYNHELIPKHGPGKTEDRILGNQKFNLFEWTQRMEDSLLPYGEYAIPSWRHYYQLDRVSFLEPGAERPVKVVTVPKTLKTPRIIAIEPTCMQYMQQGIARALIEEVVKQWPSSDKEELGHVAFGFVGTKDQEVNRLLALKGSRDGSLATLDLSEASDRVMNGHVELLFHLWPHLSDAVQATRSSKARVPGVGRQPERIVELTKFASMGSALCFPVEALVFTTIVFAAIAADLNTSLTRELISRYTGKVRVYGDDIIIPVEHVQTVIRYLEAFGLKVNSDKSFWTGKFRESCGGDYYNGESVKPVYLRHSIPRTLSDVDEVMSLVPFRNQLYWLGMWKTAAYLDSMIVPLFKGAFPIVEPTASGLGRESVLPYKAEKMHDQLHTPMVKVYVGVSKIPESPLDGVGALLKCLLKQGDEPFEDRKHLERQGRPVAVGIKRRWSRPY